MWTLLVDGDPLLFRSAWGKNSLNAALKSYRDKLQDIKDCMFDPDVKTKIAVFGTTNFRKEFCPVYKTGESRKKAKENNQYYFKLREHLLARGEVIEAVGMEADDLVRIWSFEEKEKGNDKYVIVSIDKDLHCIAGVHYLIHQDRFLYVDEDTADINYWEQVLQGDSTDDIPGLWQVGPVKAKKILEGASTSLERKQRVIDAYYKQHGDDWKEKMIHTGTLVHIMRTHDDMFCLREDDCPSELKDE